MRHRPIVKVLLLLFFLVGVFLALRSPAVAPYLSEAAIGSFLGRSGMWAPLAYIVAYALGVALLVPGTLLTAAGAVLFGTWLGTAYTIIGATLGAALAFQVSRTLGREFAQRLVGGKLKAYDEKMAEHGFATVFYLRMIFFPFIALNYGAGLTGVRFRDYIAATFLGIIPGTFVITFFVATLAGVVLAHGVRSGEFLMALLSWKVGLAAALFAASFFIPFLIEKAMRRAAPRTRGKDR